MNGIGAGRLGAPLEQIALPEDEISDEKQIPAPVTTCGERLFGIINLLLEAPNSDDPGHSRTEPSQDIVEQPLEASVGNSLPAPKGYRPMR